MKTLVDPIALLGNLFVVNLPWVILIALFPPIFPLAILIQEPKNLALIFSAFGM